MNSHHSTPARWVRRLAALAGAAVLPTVVACAPPGSGNTATVPTDPGPVSIDLGTDPIELTLYDGAGLKKIDEALVAAFTERHPNVTITARYDPDDVQAVNAPRVLASENPPDIARIIALPAAVANRQLTELDPWADAYGWNALPPGQMAMYRVDANGVRGTGPQYTMASGFTVTGFYYNKELADRIGMAEPPATVAEFERALASAKGAGLVPIMAGNKSSQVTFLVQMMLNSALGPDAVDDWVFNAPGATLDTPAAVDAAAVVADWAAKGYLPADTNGTDATAAAGRFAAGEALFYVSGNWDAATLQAKMGENVGFTLPPVPSGSPVAAMSDPVSNFAIPSGSDEKNAAAAFLDFLRSDAGRQVVVDAGFAPSGTGPVPATAPGSLGAEIQAAFDELVAADGQVQFVQNATNGMSGTWLPQVQMLVAGRTTPGEMMAAVQSAYEQDLLR
ncbi:ABC transporter substrate-binding protein [Rhodococcus rhodochrous]|uniref:ABC transporter substrate-binding protein n=1 Tax=Rhodococcus rhodochrous KG-21 TaxID=1441923 RepID=A0A0M8PFZ6_RHORH|nr:extracellular solute-binding protein [Rhodococcus rhodochrous]KOS54145.1 ABC transporter substrate-binding protein [Rhodococcus rhodochrous KG-21]